MSRPVLQLVNIKVGTRHQPGWSNQIIELDAARNVHAVNNGLALAAGFNSVLEPNHNRVVFTETADPPNVQITQWFIPFDHRYYNPIGFAPITGSWDKPQATTQPPDPQMKTIQAPPAGRPGTDIILTMGQSNAGGYGEGRYQAQLSLDGGSGGYCWNDTIHAFQPLADPLGGGDEGRGFDAGCWARLGRECLGKLAIPETLSSFPTPTAMNRLIVSSGTGGGSEIGYWADTPVFFDSSSTTNIFPDISLGNVDLTWTVSTGRAIDNALHTVKQFTATSAGVEGMFMWGTVKSYNPTTGQLVTTIFSVNDPASVGLTGTAWNIRPIAAGGGFAAGRAQLTSMIAAGFPPRRVVFVHGENQGNLGAPTWADASTQGLYWLKGFDSWSVGIKDAAVAAAGYCPLIYLAKTSICSRRGDDFTTQQRTDASNKTPQDLISLAKSRFQQRAVAWARVNSAVSPNLPIRLGVDLDQYGPDCRPDGCHIGNRGLDLQAIEWANIFYVPIL